MATPLGEGGGLRLVVGLLVAAVLALLGMQLAGTGRGSAARETMRAPGAGRRRRRRAAADRRPRGAARNGWPPRSASCGRCGASRRRWGRAARARRRPSPAAGARRARCRRGYLEQHVLSFRGGGTGSEYFRLAVEAYAPELVTEIAGVFLSPSRPALLRQRLVEVLGDGRLRGQSRAIDPLLAFLRMGGEAALLLAAVGSLASIGDAAAGRGPEGLVWRLESGPVRLAGARAAIRLGASWRTRRSRGCCAARRTRRCRPSW